MTRAAIAVADPVRIVEMTGSPGDHLLLPMAARLPCVGDVGIVVDIAARMGGVGRHYTVALREGADEAAAPVWLAVFAAHELEVVT